MELDTTEKYLDIIERCKTMRIDELVEFEKQMKDNEISYRHQLISSEVLKWRLEKALGKIKTYAPTKIKIKDDE
tara:strand:+ start:2408 stop:2629 length:222 start_codon:yes stop_codon:yes gene_type:complete